MVFPHPAGSVNAPARGVWLDKTPDDDPSPDRLCQRARARRVAPRDGAAVPDDVPGLATNPAPKTMTTAANDAIASAVSARREFAGS